MLAKPAASRLRSAASVVPPFEVTARRIAGARQGGGAGIPVAVNIGKSKVTPLDEAPHDHLVSYRLLRGVADFEYEFQMSTMNNLLHPELETVFMMTEKSHFFVSSQLVREVASLGGEVAPLVPPTVLAALQAKVAARGR